MGADNQFAGLVKKMLFKFKTSIESKQIPKDITKIEQEKNIIENIYDLSTLIFS
jgi:hypothetical protein